MKSIPETMAEIQGEFTLFDDSRDKYLQLVDIGRSAAGLEPEQRTEDNLITGCVSQAWIVFTDHPQRRVEFHTDSDALIVKGLLKLLERLFNGHAPEEVLEVHGNTILEEIGLGGSISSQRTNGFASAIRTIQTRFRA